MKSPYRDPDASVENASEADKESLREDARSVFNVSKHLTAKQRIYAELFDNKINGFRTEESPFGVQSIGSAVRFSSEMSRSIGARWWPISRM